MLRARAFELNWFDSEIATPILHIRAVALNFYFDRPVSAIVLLVLGIITKRVGSRGVLEGTLDTKLDFILIDVGAPPVSCAMSSMVSCESVEVDIVSPRASIG